MTFSEPSMPPHKIASAFSQLAANHLIGAVKAMNRRSERPLSIALRSGFTTLVWQRSILSTASNGGSGPNCGPSHRGRCGSDPGIRGDDPPRYLPRSLVLTRGSLPHLPSIFTANHDSHSQKVIRKE
jgi:hypothetical protein